MDDVEVWRVTLPSVVLRKHCTDEVWRRFWDAKVTRAVLPWTEARVSMEEERRRAEGGERAFVDLGALRSYDSLGSSRAVVYDGGM